MQPIAYLLLWILQGMSCQQEEPIQVTVLVIMASKEHKKIDEKLADIAKEIQKKDSELRGFRLEHIHNESLKLGDKKTFKLVDKVTVDIKLDDKRDAQGRVIVSLRSDDFPGIKYACTCGKYFPVGTGYWTSKPEVLIIAVMAKPCTKK